MRRLAAAAAAAAVGEGGDDGVCFPSTTQRRTCALPLRTRDLGPDPGRNRSRVGCLDLQPARGEAGGNTYLCIFGNLWACLFAGKSGFLPPWVLEARVAKGHRLEEDQEWAAWGGAEATVGENSHRLGVRGASAAASWREKAARPPSLPSLVPWSGAGGLASSLPLVCFSLPRLQGGRPLSTQRHGERGSDTQTQTRDTRVLGTADANTF